MDERASIHRLVMVGHTVSYVGNFRIYHATHNVFVVKDFLKNKTHSYPDDLEKAIGHYFSLIAGYEAERRMRQTEEGAMS
jgi:hypothetical protein